MRKVFKDPHLEEGFQENGFVRIPFLNKEEVDSLVRAYLDTLPEKGGPVQPDDENYKTDNEVTYDLTFIDKNIEYKDKVMRIINGVFEKRYQPILDNYTPIIANFIFKEKFAGAMPMHQNWAFVDEKKCTSVTIWCSLIDSTEENGTLQVVPKSHKRFGAVRGPMIRSELLEIEDTIKEHCMIPLETKAGDAVIIDDSIVHFTAPNNTDQFRLAIQLILIPAEEQSIHYHMDHSKSRKTVETLAVDQSFYTKFNPWKKPDSDLKRLNTFEFHPFNISFEDFKQAVGGKRFDNYGSTGIVQKFKSLLGI